MLAFPDLTKLKAAAAREGWLRTLRSFVLLIGEGAFELGVSLVVMVLVERSLGAAGLGIFAYLLSVFVFAGVVSNFGISRYLEHEIAVATSNAEQIEAIEKAVYAGMVSSGLCAAILVVFAAAYVAQTRVDETGIAYIIIAAVLPVRILNANRMAVLQGSGMFTEVASLRTMKRVLLFLAVFILLAVDVRPSFLMGAYLFSELGLWVKSRKRVRLGKLGALWKRRWSLRATLGQSRCFFLTDDAHDVLLYMDFFILGHFLSSSDIGIYAEASILARMFLLIPTGIRPVFRKKYCALAAEGRIKEAIVTLRKSTAVLFFFHSVMALYILLFFTEIMQSLYLVRDIPLASFYIFAEILPGLLFFSTVTSQEPVYEAVGKVFVLQKSIFFAAVLNLVLNCFFVPFSGFYGAAIATSGTMFAYFMLFGRAFKPLLIISNIRYVYAGAAVYLTYVFFRWLAVDFIAAFFLIPATLLLLFHGVDMFNFEFQTSPQCCRSLIAPEPRRQG